MMDERNAALLVNDKISELLGLSGLTMNFLIHIYVCISLSVYFSCHVHVHVHVQQTWSGVPVSSSL